MFRSLLCWHKRRWIPLPSLTTVEALRRGGGGNVALCPHRFLHTERVDHLPIIHPGMNADDPYGKKKMKRLRDQRRRQRAKSRDGNGSSNRPSYRLIDRIRLQVSGGRGGNGSLSLHRISRKRHFKPDGGHGGNGGSVILIADPHCTSLKSFRPHVSAIKGGNGTSNMCHGGRGRNVVLRIPIGVVVKRILDDDEVWDEETKTVVRTFDEDDNDYDDDGGGDGDDDNNDDIRWDNKDGFVNSGYDNDNDDEETDEETDDYEDDYETDEDSSLLLSGDESDADPVPVDLAKNDDDDDDPPAAPPTRRKNTTNVANVWYLDDDDNSLSDEETERRTVIVADLDSPGSHVVVARGGLGGRGESVVLLLSLYFLVVFVKLTGGYFCLFRSESLSLFLHQETVSMPNDWADCPIPCTWPNGRCRKTARSPFWNWNSK
jgi:GTPase involved in cell partitioning and DNA repair